MSATNLVSANDVAAYIIAACGEMTTMKLHKLLYYSQAWSLVWDEEQLFPEKIKAWANGPVVPAIFEQHRGFYKVYGWPKGDASKLSAAQRETVDAVIKFYGHYSAQQLSELTHRETPWIESRQGVVDGERGNKDIPLDSMMNYYSGL